MPRVRIRLVPNGTVNKQTLEDARNYWGTEPLTVYGYNPNGYFLVWNQNIAEWSLLNKSLCVPCD